MQRLKLNVSHSMVFIWGTGEGYQKMKWSDNMSIYWGCKLDQGLLQSRPSGLHWIFRHLLKPKVSFFREKRALSEVVLSVWYCTFLCPSTSQLRIRYHFGHVVACSIFTPNCNPSMISIFEDYWLYDMHRIFPMGKWWNWCWVIYIINFLKDTSQQYFPILLWIRP